MKKQKRVTLKDEVAENVYKKCKSEHGNDPLCDGLYAQHKAGMITTETYLDKMDDVRMRKRRRKKKKAEEAD